MFRIKAGFIPLLLSVLMCSFFSWSVSAREAMPLILTDGRFSDFDAQHYVNENHAYFSSRSEAISHWAAYYRVNPILLSHLLAVRHPDDLPSNEIIRDMASALPGLQTGSLESNMNAAEPRQVLAESLGKKFNLTSHLATQVVDRAVTDAVSAGLSFPLAIVSDLPPALDLPFARPQSWQFSGSHTWTGNDDGSPMSSIDYTRTWGLRWGDNTSSDWVSAAHDGVVSVYSSCFIQIQHESGWATRYYHLDNLQVSQGDTVMAGQPLAVYADQEAQALCSGGHSTGPHVHFALLRDGQYFSMKDIEFSGYKVHPGTSSYDSNRNRMWLEKRGTRYYAHSHAISSEEGDNTIDYRYNGMWFSPDSNGHGINVEITEFPAEEGSRKSAFIVMYTYDDTGMANFYVGNIDYERWRSDESMVIDLLQTAGGDLTNLNPIDFNNPDDVKVAGQAEIGFLDCNHAVVSLNLEERSTGQQIEQSMDLVKLIGVPEHICKAASIPLPPD